MIAAFVVVVLHAGRAAADPVAISGFLFGQLRGAQVQEELHLAFPRFMIVLPDLTHLQSGFCIDGSGMGRRCRSPRPRVSFRRLRSASRGSPRSTPT